MRVKFLVLALVCLFLMCCAQKVNETQAEKIIRKAFELSEGDTVEILGISMESKKEAIVKFNLNEVQISSKMRKYDTGWQLDEVQNELGMWIPAENLTRLFSQSEKQKAAMIDVMTISTAIADYVTDNGVAPTSAADLDTGDVIIIELSPFYIKELPIKDPWGNNYRIYCGLSVKENYGVEHAGYDDFMVICLGRDGKEEIWEYNSADPNAGLFIISSPEDFNKDLIMWNGSWVRAPRVE